MGIDFVVGRTLPLGRIISWQKGISKLLNACWLWLHARLKAMFFPDVLVGTVEDLGPDFLRQQGISALIIDLDDTLVASNAQHINEAFRLWLKVIKEAKIPIVILSNGSPKRVGYWSRELGIVGFPLTGKPFRGFKKALKYLGTQASETAMIGDQVFTDVLGAKLLGLKAILVRPLSPGLFLHTRLLRHVEALVLKGGRHGRSFDRG